MSVLKINASLHPLPGGPVESRFIAAEGKTILEILETVDPVLVHATDYVDCAVYVGDVYVSYEYWPRVRPKAGAEVFIYVTPAGGGDGKNPMAVIATVAVIGLASWTSFGVAGLGVFAEGGALAGWGGVAGGLAGGLVSIAGGLVVGAMVPVQSANYRTGRRDEPQYAITGLRNTVDPYGAVTRHFGKHKQFPKYAALPYTEILGDDTYYRCFFLVGYGDYNITTEKIGETLTSNFEEVEREIYDSGNPYSVGSGLYPNTVYEDSFAGLDVTYAGGEVVRTTQTDTDAANVILEWPNGLWFYSDANGEVRERTVVFEYRYRVSPSGSWSTPVQINLEDEKTALFRRGYSITFPSRDQYDVGVKRISEDYDATDKKDNFQWASLQSINYDAPVDQDMLDNCTFIGMRILASGQLSGMLDGYNIEATAKLKTYNGTSWTSPIATRSPAWAIVDLLTGYINNKSVTTSEIDADAFKSWADSTDTEGRYFDAVIDRHGKSVFECCQDIASMARARLTKNGNKFTVKVDEQQSTIAAHIGPRNSWGFRSKKIFPTEIHGLRCNFINAAKDWAEDERLVFRDGYSESNATKYEKLEFWGVTDTDIVWKDGRYHLAVQELRPEEWSVFQDIEAVKVSMGDLVRFTHDVMLVGLGQARITSVTLDGSNRCTAVDVDEILEMESGKSYGARIRLSDDSSTYAAVDTVVGEVENLTFPTPIPAADSPEAGDLLHFGETDQETIPALVTKILHAPNLTAQVFMVDEGAGVYTADSGTIPDYDSHITYPPDMRRDPPSPQILDVFISYLSSRPGTDSAQPYAILSFATDSTWQIPISHYEAQYKRSEAGTWEIMPPVDKEVRRIEFPVKVSRTATPYLYDFRVRAVSIYGKFSAWDSEVDFSTAITSVMSANVTGLQILGGGTAWTGNDCHIEWDECEHVNFSHYKVQIERTYDSLTLRTVDGWRSNTFVYTKEMNSEDTNGSPARGLTFYVWNVDTYGQASSSDPSDLASISTTNAAPDMSSATPTATAKPGYVLLEWTPVSDPDALEYRVFYGTSSPPSTEYGRFRHPHNSVEIHGLTPEQTYYFKVVPYDVFGIGTASQIANTAPLYITDVDIDEELQNTIQWSDSDGNSQSTLESIYDKVLDSGGVSYSMSGSAKYIEASYKLENYFDRVGLWLSGDAYVYFATYDGTSWTYWKAETDHTLTADSELIEAANESDADTNYWATSSGFNFAKLPNNVAARKVRVYFTNGTYSVTVYEFVPARIIISEIGVIEYLSSIVTYTGNLVLGTNGSIQSENYGASQGLKIDEKTAVFGGTSDPVLQFDQDASVKLQLKGAMEITSSSSGYSNFSDKPTQLSDINSSEGSHLSGIESGADVTAGQLAGRGTNVMPAEYAIFGPGSLPPTADGGTSTGTHSLHTTGGYYRDYSLKTVVTDTGGDYGVWLGSSSSDYNVWVEANKKWIMSAWVWTDTAGRQCQIHFKSNNGNFYTVTESSLPASTWERVSGVIDLTSDGANTGVIRVDNDAEQNGAIYFDCIMLEPVLGTQTSPSPFIMPGDRDPINQAQFRSTLITGDMIQTPFLQASHIGATEVIANVANIKNAMIETLKVKDNNISKTGYFDISSQDVSNGLWNDVGSTSFMIPADVGGVLYIHFRGIRISMEDKSFGAQFRIELTYGNNTGETVEFDGVEEDAYTIYVSGTELHGASGFKEPVIIRSISSTGSSRTQTITLKATGYDSLNDIDVGGTYSEGGVNYPSRIHYIFYMR